MQPLKFIFPTYRGTEWKRWKLGIGVKIYDLLCGKSNLGRSKILGRQILSISFRAFCTNGLTGGGSRFDGFTTDARGSSSIRRSASPRVR